jgi:hypothetical protein
VVVLGAGIFGLTAAILLGEAGYRVTIVEQDRDVMRRASLVNQNRVHLGYHYPRSPETVNQALAGLADFRRYYGSSIVRTFSKYYAVAREGSATGPDEFERFCARMGLPLEPGWPPREVLNRDDLAACWRAPEAIFDFHELRGLVISRIAAVPNISLLRGAAPRAITLGEPHLVTLTSGTILAGDALVNATYAGMSSVEELMGRGGAHLDYELCAMVLLSRPEPAEPDPAGPYGITVMDGPFASLMPRGRLRDHFILYDVERSVLQRRQSRTEPRWDPIEGFPELELIEACRRWFPVLSSMRFDDTWLTTRTVLPAREHDDARPTLLRVLAPRVFSLFSGKLTTCVTLAREVLRALAAAGLTAPRPADLLADV